MWGSQGEIKTTASKSPNTLETNSDTTWFSMYLAVLPVWWGGGESWGPVQAQGHMTGCVSRQLASGWKQVADVALLLQKGWRRQRLGLESAALHPTGPGQGSEAGLRCMAAVALSQLRPLPFPHLPGIFRLDE